MGGGSLQSTSGAAQSVTSAGTQASLTQRRRGDGPGIAQSSIYPVNPDTADTADSERRPASRAVRAIGLQLVVLTPTTAGEAEIHHAAWRRGGSVAARGVW